MRKSEWTNKVMAILRTGNTGAAIAQIKVAPSVKDLKALRAALEAPPFPGRWPDVEAAIVENLLLLSAPRLHRAP